MAYHGAIIQQDNLTAEKQRMIGVVRGKQYGFPICGKLPDNTQKKGLIAKIQRRHRLIQNNDGRILHQRTRQQDQLLLSAAEIAEWRVKVLRCTHFQSDFLRKLIFTFSGHGKGRQVWCAAFDHKITDFIVDLSDGGKLRHNADDAGVLQRR